MYVMLLNSQSAVGSWSDVNFEATDTLNNYILCYTLCMYVYVYVHCVCICVETEDISDYTYMYILTCMYIHTTL